MVYPYGCGVIHKIATCWRFPKAAEAQVLLKQNIYIYIIPLLRAFLNFKTYNVAKLDLYYTSLIIRFVQSLTHNRARIIGISITSKIRNCHCQNIIICQLQVIEYYSLHKLANPTVFPIRGHKAAKRNQ